MNPILPRQFFVPDGEAHVMPDGRLYLYGSLDISGNDAYCSKEHRVFSTDNPKLERWIDHGTAFCNTAADSRVPWRPDTVLSAPDAIEKDGKYYMFVCGEPGFEGVAQADSPAGPFGPARPIPIADGDGIDPAVFVDDDGQAYLFWGQFHLRGARLNPDMCSIDETTLCQNLLTEEAHGFHEGSSLRKRGGIYYLVYTDISRGNATCLSYATAAHPLGPYQKRGTIIDNMYCDPKTWNNHGSIAEYGGQWYVFYHRASQNSIFSRRACAEPIYFNEDGSISEVEMTSQGASGPICAYCPVDASLACRVFGGAYIAPFEAAGGTAENGNSAETARKAESSLLTGGSTVREVLTGCGRGTWSEGWAEYKYLDFGTGGALRFEIRASGKGRITVKTKNRTILGSCEVNQDTLTLLSASVQNAPAGIQPVWLFFDGKNITVDYFCFYR